MTGYEIGILGYSLRAPGVADLEEFWTIIETGRDVISRQRSNVGATSSSRVQAYGHLSGVDAFDHTYFGYSPREAADLDPQQRLLLECAVESLETAAVPYGGPGLDIGVYCSTGLSGYLLNTYERSLAGGDLNTALLGGDGQYAATRIAFQLGLTGPAISVGTACSSSLVAVHLAATALLAGECDVAVAGGLDIEYPQPSSYLFQEGGIMSRTGVCRPFDRAADGVVFASGGGLVVLAPLELARERGWPVRAVLHGTAVNNDGSRKASFTAPLATRQAEVIRQALAAADLAPRDIGYVECHGTGTLLGDRSELQALHDAFDGHPVPPLGSLKGNLGHLRVGAGVAGLIKAAEIARRGVVPPMANTTSPLDRVGEIGATIPVAATPVDTAILCGVSSFGFGGTNAHAIVGTAAPAAPAAPAASAVRTEVGSTEEPAVLRVSAPTPEACLATAAAVGASLTRADAPPLADVSRTLEHGRGAFAYRCAVAGRRDEVGPALTNSAGADLVEGWAVPAATVVVHFPGQGSDLGPLVRTLRGWEEGFTAALDGYLRHLRALCPEASALDWSLLSPPMPSPMPSPSPLPLAAVHGAHVAVGLALWDQLAGRGLRPDAFVGYSLGEYVAAAAAGALTGEDAVTLAVRRGALLEEAPPGALLVVEASEPDHAHLSGGRAIAIRQSRGRIVYAVAAADLDRFRDTLRDRRLPFRVVENRIPYHCALLGSVADRFRPIAAATPLRPGTRFRPATAGADAADASYFADHLERGLDYVPVLAGLDPDAIHLDLDPAGVLGHALRAGGAAVVAVRAGDRTAYLRSLAQAWVRGVDLSTLEPANRGRLVALPTTRFHRTPHARPLLAAEPAPAARPSRPATRRESSLDRWMYYPSWSLRRRPAGRTARPGERWLVFGDATARALGQHLTREGIDVVLVEPDSGSVGGPDSGPDSGSGGGPDSGSGGGSGGPGLRPGDRAAMASFVDSLAVADRPVDRVVHLWCAGELAVAEDVHARLGSVDLELERGFYTLLYLIQELTRRQGAHPLHLDIVARGMHPVDPAGIVPERALLAGPTLVVPQDLPFTSARSVDIAAGLDDLAEELGRELLSPAEQTSVALDGSGRWVRTYQRDQIAAVPDDARPFRLRDNGVYLITGGVGGIGMTIADYLVEQCAATVVLTGLDVVPTMEMINSSEPPPLEDPLLAERVARVRRLVEKGGRVLTARCDAADLAQSRALFEQIDTRFGRLDGVVHAAGVFETQRAFRGLEDTGPDDCSRRLLPKVNGTIVLAECLRGRSVDFLLMQSSLSSHLGGLGFYAYTAGNAYMDAFAELHRGADLPWMSVNWDGWVFSERDESSSGSVVSPSFASPDFGVVAEIAIRPSEGAQIYGRLMNLEEPHQVLVSTADFEQRVEQWVTRSPRPAGRPAGRGADGGAAPGHPDGPAPAWTGSMTPTEAQVATVWSELLGTTELDPDSNFFSLGGDSLLGVSLAFRLSTDFDVVLSVITMFDTPTIRAMAAEIERLTLSPVGGPR